MADIHEQGVYMSGCYEGSSKTKKIAIIGSNRYHALQYYVKYDEEGPQCVAKYKIANKNTDHTSTFMTRMVYKKLELKGIPVSYWSENIMGGLEIYTINKQDENAARNIILETVFCYENDINNILAENERLKKEIRETFNKLKEVNDILSIHVVPSNQSKLNNENTYLQGF